MDLILTALDGEPERDWAEPPRRRRARKSAVIRHTASVAAWLEKNRGQIIECGRHNGLARLTVQACAERYRRAVTRWVDTLKLHENEKQALRFSFATCAACPVGAYNAQALRRR